MFDDDKTIQELNTRWGAPGRIVFRRGHCGFPEAAIACQYGSAEISLLGANVLSYKPTGHAPVLFRGAKRDYARGESFHGGMPLCWPQFGKFAIEGMAAHGFARIMPFRVKSSRYTNEETELVLCLDSSPETEAIWPVKFHLEVRISVTMKLNAYVTTLNIDAEPFGYSAGFHPYLLVRNRDDASIRGLDGKSFVNAADMSRGVQSGDFKLDFAPDHVFELPQAPKHEFAVADPGLRRAIAVVSHGARNIVAWNPGPSAPLPDLAPDDWRSFVCLEPVTDWPKPLKPLAPGEAETLAIAIQPAMEQ